MWEIIKERDVPYPNPPVVKTIDLYTEQAVVMFRRLALGVEEFSARHLDELQHAILPHESHHEL